jgi:NAD(P)-dependent dehydrogenase (short-subunit alcohol dehydrogenase family)
MPDLTGRTALVIGGSSGMGRGAARAYAARGGEVWVTSRAEDRLEQAIAAVLDGLEPLDGARATGGVQGVACDLGDLASVTAAVARPPELTDLVVSAAPAAGGTDREFFDGKFWGSQAACAAAAERLPDHGSIVLVSGGMAVRPVAGSWSVTCAFAAVEALARALAVELAPRRVTCIRPGLFDTGTWSAMTPDERERFFAERTARLPAGRPASGADFGDATVGVLSSAYLTGQVVVLDGGEALLGG